MDCSSTVPVVPPLSTGWQPFSLVLNTHPGNRLWGALRGHDSRGEGHWEKERKTHQQLVKDCYRKGWSCSFVPDMVESPRFTEQMMSFWMSQTHNEIRIQHWCCVQRVMPIVALPWAIDISTSLILYTNCQLLCETKAAIVFVTQTCLRATVRVAVAVAGWIPLALVSSTSLVNFSLRLQVPKQVKCIGVTDAQHVGPEYKLPSLHLILVPVLFSSTSHESVGEFIQLAPILSIYLLHGFCN